MSRSPLGAGPSPTVAPRPGHRRAARTASVICTWVVWNHSDTLRLRIPTYRIRRREVLQLREDRREAGIARSDSR